MLTPQLQPSPNHRVIIQRIESDSIPLSYAQVIEQWEQSPDFCSFFIDLLATSPFPAFRWETPSLTSATLGQPFEFALLESPEIALAPDPETFARHFAGAGEGAVVEFANLGGDAVLVAPCPDRARSDFSHLGAFVRNADHAQQQALWAAVGRAMRRRIGSRPVWLNTAGGGVAWLHVRLDDRPKYYAQAPYREACRLG
jgi:hypothetical protein